MTISKLIEILQKYKKDLPENVRLYTYDRNGYDISLTQRDITIVSYPDHTELHIGGR